MPRPVWAALPTPSLGLPDQEREPRGLFDFISGNEDGGSDFGDDIGPRLGVISQILMGLGSGRGPGDVAGSLAALEERSVARREKRKAERMVNRAADKIEERDPELAAMMRANTKFGMEMIGKKYEMDWQTNADITKAEKMWPWELKKIQETEKARGAAVAEAERLKREWAAKAWGVDLNDPSASAAATIPATTAPASPAVADTSAVQEPTSTLEPALAVGAATQPAPAVTAPVTQQPAPAQIPTKPPEPPLSTNAVLRNIQERIGGRLGFGITQGEAQRFLNAFGDQQQQDQISRDVITRHNKEMEPYVRRQQLESSLDIQAPLSGLGPGHRMETAVDPRTVALLKKGGITQPYSVPDPVQAAAQLETGFMSGDAGMAQATGDVGAIQAKAAEDRTKQVQDIQDRQEIAAVVKPVLADPTTPVEDYATLQAMLVGNKADLPTHMVKLSQITQDRLKLAQDEAQFQRTETRLDAEQAETKLEHLVQQGFSRRRLTIDEQEGVRKQQEHEAKFKTAADEAKIKETKLAEYKAARDVTLQKSRNNIADAINILAEAGPLTPTTGAKGYLTSFLGGDTVAGQLATKLTSVMSDQALAEIQTLRIMAEAVGSEGTGLGQTMLKEFEALQTRLSNLSQFGNDQEGLVRELKSILNLQLDLLHGAGKGPLRYRVDGNTFLEKLEPGSDEDIAQRDAALTEATKRGGSETQAPAVEAKPDEEGFVPYAGGNKRIKRIKEITP